MIPSNRWRFLFRCSIIALTALTAVTTVSARALELSSADKKAVYQAAGLTARNGHWRDACDQPTQPETDVVDLNGDGTPEVFVLVAGLCSGGAGASLSLLIKDKDARWTPHLGFPVGGYKILPTKHKGYPDIEIYGPGSCFPVWRWNGKQYDIHKRCAR